MELPLSLTLTDNSSKKSQGPIDELVTVRLELPLSLILADNSNKKSQGPIDELVTVR